MGDQSPPDDGKYYIFRADIQEGRNFGPDVQAVVCAATFAGDTKLTPYSVGRENHTWNVSLQWKISHSQFRRLLSLGQKDCKVVCSNKDGAKLGWFLLDLRTAKLQHQYKKEDGEEKGPCICFNCGYARYVVRLETLRKGVCHVHRCILVNPENKTSSSWAQSTPARLAT